MEPNIKNYSGEPFLEIEEKLKEIFYKFRNLDIAQQGFVYHKIDPQKKVLFVGINPSHDGTDNKNYGVDPRKAEHSHYKRIQKLVSEVNDKIQWNYIDLFYFRQTKQGKIYSIMQCEGGEKFIFEQLLLTMNILEELKPKLIIVLNRGAQDFFGVNKKTNNEGNLIKIWMGYEFKDATGIKTIRKEINKNSIMENHSTSNLYDTRVIFSRSLLCMPKSERDVLAKQISQEF